MNNEKRLRILSALLATSIAACSDAAANGPPHGNPILTLHAQVTSTIDTPPPRSPAVGILWVAQNGNVGAGEVTAIRGATWPAGGFDIDIFAPPPDAVIDSYVDTSGNVVAQIAWGVLFAFDDVDGDGAFQLSTYGIAAPDQFIAVAPDNALIYVKMQPTSDGNARFGNQVSSFTVSKLITNWTSATPGFHLGQGV